MLQNGKYWFTLIFQSVVLTWGPFYWALQLRPLEANIFYNIPGKRIYLYDLAVAEKNKRTNWKREVFEYDKKGIRTASLVCLNYTLMFVQNYFKNKYIQYKKKLNGMKR